VDIVTLTYVIGFLNYHGLLSVYFNEYTREKIYEESLINEQFAEIIKGEEWNIRKNL